MFECLVGWPPFCAENRQDVYRKIVSWQQSLYFPDDVKINRMSEHLIRRYVCFRDSLYPPLKRKTFTLPLPTHEPYPPLPILFLPKILSSNFPPTTSPSPPPPIHDLG